MEEVRNEKVEEEKQQASSENNTTPTWANKQRRLSKKKSSRGRSFKLRSDTLNSLRLRRVFDLFDKNGDGLVSVSEIRQALVLLGLDEDKDETNGDNELQDHHPQQPEEADANADDVDHHPQQQQQEEQSEEDELDSIVSSFIKPRNQGLAFEDFESLHDSLSNNTFFFDCLDDNDGCDQSLNPITKDTTEDDDHEQQVESDLTEAFKVFDSNGDGYISAMELQQVLSKLGFPEAQQELPNIQLMLSSFDHDHDGRVDFFEFKHMMSRTLLLPS